MPLVSSPIAYASSSPGCVSPRKKRKIEQAEREPLQHVPANTQPKAIAGFLLQDSDDDGDAGDVVGVSSRRNQKVYLENGHLQLLDGIARVDGPKPSEQYKAESPDNLVGTEKQPSKSSGDSRNGPLLGVLKTEPWIKCGSGRAMQIRRKFRNPVRSYEQTIADRSTSSTGCSEKSYYGIEIHQLIEQACRATNNSNPCNAEVQASASNDSEQPAPAKDVEPKVPRTLMWTEKYRARKFTDLVGDERTHRSVLKWLKAWDSTVFPHAARTARQQRPSSEETGFECTHKKILLLTGPPGLGKTTLAHVCARQAGYEIQEINASDERSRDVVKGRIRDMVGTENVKQVGTTLSGKGKRIARPVCVVVDEVDGVVGGSAGGEGGFIKALADLVALDQKNGNTAGSRNNSSDTLRKKKGDQFRLLRPLILICNDVYHPSLRLLRQGSMAEVIFVRKPPLNLVVPRVQQIFEREGIRCDSDGARQLCEATWGVSNRKEEKAGGGTCDGDMRGILVISEWVASRLRAEGACGDKETHLTKKWIEQNILGDLSHGGGFARSLGRGSAKELVDRIFAHNAGFPSTAPVGHRNDEQRAVAVAESAPKKVMDRLRELIASNGEDDRAMTECFSVYPSLPYQDDNFLTKPSMAYDWLHFHDQLSSFVHGSQEWELAPYLSTPLLAFHDLFASNSRLSYSIPTNSITQLEDSKTDAEATVFTGPRASHAAFEATKANRAALQHLQSQLSLSLHRAFRSAEDLSVELLPYVLRMLSPDVKPVVVGGSENGVASVRRGVEKEMIRRAVDAMIACGVKFERGRVDQGDRPKAGGAGSWIYRMEPALDALREFETAEKGSHGAKTRFAVRQVMEQEWKREVARREQEARVRRMRGVFDDAEEIVGVLTGKRQEENDNADTEKTVIKPPKVVSRTDFFGRPIPSAETARLTLDTQDWKGEKSSRPKELESSEENKVWVTYHEGFSNAVRKGITLQELLGFPMVS